jgi:hypothetical protein
MQTKPFLPSRFPKPQHPYTMMEGEFAKLMAALKK